MQNNTSVIEAVWLVPFVIVQGDDDFIVEIFGKVPYSQQRTKSSRGLGCKVGSHVSKSLVGFYQLQALFHSSVALWLW